VVLSLERGDVHGATEAGGSGGFPFFVYVISFLCLL
jgi:hypothetical protein